jgi:hypothetical protein
MGSRSDPAYANQYESDRQWYSEFISKQKEPTDMQRYTISKIEERTGILFHGTTVCDASQFISMYGLSKYNDRFHMNL